MTFQKGDRVRVVAGPSARYIGGEGIFVKMTGRTYRGVIPDPSFLKQMGYATTSKVGTWDFSEDWTLELIDDAKSFEPEDWS